MNLNQITVPSKNVERSIKFYEILGLELIVKALPHYARFQCPQGSSTFSVHLEDQIPSDNGVMVYFELNDLDEKVLALKNQGVVFDLDPTDQRWLWREARLCDPDGNKIILYHAGENRLNPPWRV